MVVAVGNGAAHVELLHHYAVHVDGGRMAPDRHDHHHARRLGRGDQGVHHLVHAGALEGHIHPFATRERHHLLDYIHLRGVENVVGYAGFTGLLFALGTQLGDDHAQALGLEDRRQQQTDWPGATDQRHVANLGTTAHKGMMTDRKRLDQRRLIQRDLVGNRVNPAALDSDLFRQAATMPAQADEVHVLGQVIAVARPGGYVVGNDVGLDHHMLPNLDVIDAFAHCVDHPGKLMAHGDGRRFAGNRVWMAARRDEDRPFHELVQVSAADAAPGDVDADGAGFDHWLGDVLDTNVAPVVETRCFHASTSMLS